MYMHKFKVKRQTNIHLTMITPLVTLEMIPPAICIKTNMRIHSSREIAHDTKMEQYI